MMSDVFVGYGDSAKDTATLLLAEAENQDLDPAVVRSVEGGFVVDEELAKAAGVDYDSGDDESEDQGESDDKDEKPAKKSAQKKSSK